MPGVPVSRKPSEKSETADFISFLVKLALFVFVLRSFIVAPFSIPSESMQPRLLIGDYLLVAKWPYGYSKYSLSIPLPKGLRRAVGGDIEGAVQDTGGWRIFASTPERGDVAVFKAPPTQRQDYIKRVIGLPGDIIEIRNGQVILNGKPVPKRRIADLLIPVTPNMIEAAAREGSGPPCFRPDYEEMREGERFCRYPRYRETLPNGKSYNVLDVAQDGPADNRAPIVVPQGRLFMMGDNRDRSADSRFPAEEGGGIGLVPEENLVGKAMFTVFSTDGSANWLLPWTWVTAARFDRIGEAF